MDAADCVRNYKALANVERAFRSLKTVDLKVRPIHHRTADRVRAHILLCMLAYYVEWHMREAWRELMFADTDQPAKATRDPVAPAKRSKAALDKVARHTLDDGTPAHSFSTLMAELATIVRNTCRTPSAGPDAPTFEIVTTPNATQQPRARADPADPAVDRSPNPDLTPSACRARTNSAGHHRNFGLGPRWRTGLSQIMAMRRHSSLGTSCHAATPLRAIRPDGTDTIRRAPFTERCTAIPLVDRRFASSPNLRRKA